MATIAESVSALDPKEQVGALNGIVDAIFHPDHVEDGTGNPFKQAVYDGAVALYADGLPLPNDQIIATLEEATRSLQAGALAAGNDDWLTGQLETFLNQAKGTFPVEPREDDFGFPAE